MKPVRIIPRLDIKGPNLVKGIHLEGLRALGRPMNFARHYYEAGADEIIYADVVASLYQRNSLLDLVKETAGSVYIPITVAGGLRTLADIRNVLKAGADKVCINTAAIQRPEFITEAVRGFGASTIVAGIEVLRTDDNRLMAFCENGRQSTGREAVAWAQTVESLGAGEILLTSINREGTGNGFDLDLVQRVVSSVSIPVIAHGGAGTPDHVRSMLDSAEVDGVAVASMFHYHCLGLESDVQADEGNFDFVRSGRRSSKIQDLSIGELKTDLAENGILCRVVN